MTVSRWLYIVFPVWLIVSLGLLAGCNPGGKLIPIGSKSQSDSVFMPKESLSESGRFAETRRYVDSVFYKLPQPTVYDFLSRYSTNASVSGHARNLLTQIKYLDSAINLVNRYLPDQNLYGELADLLIEKGRVFFLLKNYNASFDAYFEAMQVARKYPDKCNIDRVAYNIAMILYKQQQFRSSAQYFIESLYYTASCETSIAAYRNNKEQEVLDNIGLCYTKLKQYDSAMYYYKKALDIVLKNPYNMAVDKRNSLDRQAAAAGVITGNMAKIYVGTHQTDSAIALYKRAIVYNAGHDLYDMQLCMIQLSDVYLSKPDLPSLHQTLNSLRACLDTMPSKDLEMDYERLMYGYYQKKRDPAKALLYLNGYIRKKDSIAELQTHLQQADIGSVLKDKEQKFEIQLLQKDNLLTKTYLWLFAAGSLLVIIILLLIYTSYSASKKNIRKLTELNTAITNANQDKDRILSMVAHDLRNPIGAISMLSQLLQMGETDEKKNQEILRNIESVSNNAIVLINELLIAQGIIAEAGEEKSITDIGQLLQHAVFIMQLKATEKNQQIILYPLAKTVNAPVNAVKTERVISNLLANAIKFSQVNGTIDVRIELLDKGLQISVKDNGIGMAPEHYERAFDQFTKQKRLGTAGEKGFGLGLSICKQIIEAQGGEIWVESVVGKGSTFYIRLPLS